jgi:uncharacterized protein RhaS with RHS repeats
MSYDPTIGRWTSQDPVGFKAGDTNLYRYAGNDPVDRMDPNGEEWVYPWEDNANWRDWRLGEALGDTINKLQGSGVVGVTGEVYLGLVHVQLALGFAGGFDMANRNTSTGVIVTVQYGEGLGIGAGGGPFGSLTNTGNLENLAGPGGAIGVSTPAGGIDVGGSGDNTGVITGSMGGGSVEVGIHIDGSGSLLFNHNKNPF